jgi:outer membrane PBP1 activator LpoA protein
MKQHKFLSPVFFILLLAGCATGSSNPTQRAASSNPLDQADAYMERGQHKKAAQLYQNLALSTPARKDQYSFLAAEALIQSGSIQQAEFEIDSINPTLLTAIQRNRLNLLHAQVKLGNGEAEQALDLLESVQENQLKHQDKASFYQSLGFAHSLIGDQLKSVQSRIDLNPHLENDEQRDENSTVIFNTLSSLSNEELNLRLTSSSRTLGGWMALTKILKSPELRQNPEQLQNYLNDWKRLFPQHPADAGFLQSYFEGGGANLKLPSAIAIMLPESGRFAHAAEVVKAGFMAAYHHSQSSYQPSLRYYDSSLQDPVELYQQAISEGAELVIGPLSKDNIQKLAVDAELTVPVLALNHVTDLVTDNLFQFGLSPIDEAMQVTTKAGLSGYEKALLLTAESTQGQRMAGYLTEYWEQEEGTVLEQQLYKAKESDFSLPIKALLNLDESANRYRQVKRFFGSDIYFSDRRRQDVDAIFLSAKPQDARSIYPQIQFYRAKDVPVFATPQIYSGNPNPALDIDLDGVTFCDIPWLFPAAYPGELSKDTLQETWQAFPNKYLKLMALGIDSFNLVNHLGILMSDSYMGATGKLSLNQENKITRQLVCAKFIKGEAVLQTPLYEEIKTEDEQNDFFQ